MLRFLTPDAPAVDKAATASLIFVTFWTLGSVDLMWFVTNWYRPPSTGLYPGSPGTFWDVSISNKEGTKNDKSFLKTNAILRTTDSIAKLAILFELSVSYGPGRFIFSRRESKGLFSINSFKAARRFSESTMAREISSGVAF